MPGGAGNSVILDGPVLPRRSSAAGGGQLVFSCFFLTSFRVGNPCIPSTNTGSSIHSANFNRTVCRNRGHPHAEAFLAGSMFRSYAMSRRVSSPFQSPGLFEYGDFTYAHSPSMNRPPPSTLQEFAAPNRLTPQPQLTAEANTKPRRLCTRRRWRSITHRSAASHTERLGQAQDDGSGGVKRG